MGHNGRQARFRFDRRQISASQLIAELAILYPIKDISIEEPEIEAIVRQIYQETADAGKISKQPTLST